MAQQYTNIRLIADNIMKHPLMQDINFETIIDYVVSFMRIVGAPSLYEEKVVTLEVKDYRAMLPCDFNEIIQIRDSNTKVAYIYSTNSFHMGNNIEVEEELTYKIQGSIIYTSKREGCIDIAYRAIAVDDEGYPLLPDNSSFTRALMAYIKKEWFTVLFDMGKIQPAVFQQAKQDYAWAVGDCETEFTRLSLDKAQSLFNSWNRLLLRTKEHASGFRFNNNREQIKLH